MNKPTSNQKAIVAALLAISNMGIVPDPSGHILETLREYPEGELTAGAAVMHLGSKYVEDTDAESAFEEEAEMWNGIINRDLDKMIQKHERYFRLAGYEV